MITHEDGRRRIHRGPHRFSHPIFPAPGSDDTLSRLTGEQVMYLGILHDRYIEMTHWCRSNIDSCEGFHPKALWGRYGAYHFLVREDDHALAFRMRWC
ncbi:MAG: hypothetical protein EOO77_36660 [Oxalobacteraceae bacterium]|nr:MAG: hypothetical protein EOO77_36660 [Oxalobacteraceae bacterium]